MVEALGGAVVVVYCVSIALTPGTSPAFPLLLGAMVGGGLVAMAVRSWRTASRTPAAPPTGDSPRARRSTPRP